MRYCNSVGASVDQVIVHGAPVLCEAPVAARNTFEEVLQYILLEVLAERKKRRKVSCYSSRAFIPKIVDEKCKNATKRS